MDAYDLAWRATGELVNVIFPADGHHYRDTTHARWTVWQVVWLAGLFVLSSLAFLKATIENYRHKRGEGWFAISMGLLVSMLLVPMYIS